MLGSGVRGNNYLVVSFVRNSQFPPPAGTRFANKMLVKCVTRFSLEKEYTMHVDNPNTDVDKRKAYIESIMNRLRRHYAERTPLPNDTGETLSLNMLQRLYRHVISEGYGE